jgi:SAM-dependent methyltransferase
LAEFTGERVIPDQVDPDLLNEHLARYAFAARLVAGARVLDCGCGTGYGSAELAARAASVVGADLSSEAVAYAREHFSLPNLRFEQASCSSLPHPPASFDMVVGFEVIEHLVHWREFLAEVRRVLAPGGCFVVSTPNRLYYTESRAGVSNPFHVHEFEYEEFRNELAAIFPYVSLLLENHVEGIAFQPVETAPSAEVRVDGGGIKPGDSHFFLAVCSPAPRPQDSAFVYVPTTANVLRERERHIELLEGELRTKSEWLAELERRHQETVDLFRAQKEDLEKSNRWAEKLNARIVQLQEELDTLQGKADSLKASLEDRIQELARCVEYLNTAEKTIVERTEWAQRLTAELQEAQRQLAAAQSSRWVKLGQRLGVGPTFPAS